ncbi:mRNA splicing factor rna helicase [Colletotrichum kahawae]|uniref:mRNA splicing factor rna helicase n=1 Tax=Colletotrichum kahawae TaxID=34407 RepID=A0AAD9YV37_COLKA|nr:mRNA splicing factor rna helicase [Colletotrichum kahawae]
MASPMESSAADPPTVLFRAGKKRKAGLRQRAASPEETANTAAAAAAQSKPTTTDQTLQPTETASSRAELDASDNEAIEALPSTLRHRARKRLNGVGFSARATSGPSEDSPAADLSSSRALVPAASQPDDDPLIAKRFAPQTGLATTITTTYTSSSPPSTAPAPVAGNDKKAHPIMQGKLMEVDLGDEVRARNQAMTEKAARRLLGESVPDEEPEGGPRKAKKPRLGRDGKPWRPRNRRGSDDVKRDQLVEEILRENKLDVYDVPATQQSQYEGDGDADDRIAEEFRREFMDAMVQRQQKKKAAAPPARAGARKADEDVLKGPKLGGSRNSRAAMRDLLLKKEKEGKR